MRVLPVVEGLWSTAFQPSVWYIFVYLAVLLELLEARSQWALMELRPGPNTVCRGSSLVILHEGFGMWPARKCLTRTSCCNLIQARCW